MVNFLDEKQDFYEKDIGSAAENSLDAEMKFYIKNVGASGANPDLERRWLRSKGVKEAHISDMWRQFLLDEGYTGNLRDMKTLYYSDNS